MQKEAHARPWQELVAEIKAKHQAERDEKKSMLCSGGVFCKCQQCMQKVALARPWQEIAAEVQAQARRYNKHMLCCGGVFCKCQ